ncbi:UNVERIFIED_CONTAM: hypothetical protein DV094_05295 [Bifidobacterium longum subsp. infantis]|nr:hypothetical protein [Bifidobacterium longum subsp. infantis]
MEVAPLTGVRGLKSNKPGTKYLVSGRTPHGVRGLKSWAPTCRPFSARVAPSHHARPNRRRVANVVRLPAWNCLAPSEWSTMAANPS